METWAGANPKMNSPFPELETVEVEKKTAVIQLHHEIWIPVRRGGKLLFEYDPERDKVRVAQRGQEWEIDLQGLKNGR